MPIVGGGAQISKAATSLQSTSGGWVGYIGKGIKEPVSPYRTLYVFGAPFGSYPSPSNWNYNPDIWDATNTFDLSLLKPGVEVALVLIKNYSVPGGTYTYRWKGYRDIDNYLMWDISVSFTLPGPGWVWCACIFGYCDTEISQNGLHHIDLTISGPVPHSMSVSFTITGIPEAPAPPPPSADWIDRLVHWSASLSNIMASWAATAAGWVWPLNAIAPLIIFLATIADGIFGALFDFELWVRAFIDKVDQLLNWEEIKAKLQDFLNMVADLWDWFQDKLEYIKGTISDWWENTGTLVKGWISTATEGLAGLLVAWDNFTKVTLPGLIDATWLGEWWKSRLVDIDGLIKSAFAPWAGLLSTLESLKGDIGSFFTNPLDWLWERFTDWFLGKE